MYKPIQTKPKVSRTLPLENITRCCIITFGLALACLLFIGSTSAKTEQGSFSCADVTEIPQIECEALVALYNETNGPSWGSRVGWLATNTPCHWRGVFCDGDGENITRLSLTRGLQGDIPSEIGNLNKLTQLNLRNNRLISLPPEIGNLNNLTVLGLDNNLLSNLPSSIGNLSNLTVLILDNNQLSRLPSSIGNLNDLTEITLHNNRLSELPAGIGDLNNLNLTELDLSNNQLSSLPEEIGKLNNLEELNLENNQLSSLPAGIGSLNNLSVLNLNNNQLTSLPAEIGNLSNNLQELYLSNNRLTSLPAEIDSLDNLLKLNLNYNRLSNLPVEIGDLDNLNELRLGKNHLSSLPVEISNLRNLNVLDLSCNKLSSLPVDMVKLIFLNSLDLSYNKIIILDEELLSFINELSPGWDKSQTVPPTDVEVTSVGRSWISLSWTIIDFSSYNGYYEISVWDGNEFIVHGRTLSKMRGDSYTVTELSSGTTYTIGIRTYSPDGDNSGADNQPNELYSEYVQISATTESEPTPTDTATPTPTNTLPLEAPDIRVTPTALSTTLPQGQSATKSLTIHNDGNAPLEYEITTQDETIARAAHRNSTAWPTNKVDTEVRASLDSTGVASFLVYLKTEANLDDVSQISDRAAQGEQAYDRLRSTAQESQRDLLAWLDRQQVAGHVTAYESFFIINAIAVTADSTTIDALSQHEDVGYILPQQIFLVPAPGEGRSTAQGVSAAATHDIPWNIRRIRAHEAWPEGIDGNGVTIGIIDTGVDYLHPALRDQYRGSSGNHNGHWYDALNSASQEPTDRVGHGTHVAGIAVGSNGGSQQIGVAPKAKWIAARACDQDECPDIALLRALEWMLAPCPVGVQPGHTSCEPSKRPDIVNNSWGGSTGRKVGGKYFFEEVIDKLRAAGIVPIFAAGNSGPLEKTILAPANYQSTYSVGAIDSADYVARSSSRGPSTITSKIKPDVSAPGEEIFSALPDGHYGLDSGTSMASPHVAGTVALMLQANPSLTLDEIEYILRNTAEDLGDKGPDHKYGYGLVDAYAAVQAAQESEPWLTYNSPQGTIQAGKSKTIKVTFNAAGLTAGVHRTNLVINSNDPDSPSIIVPVTLSVAEAAPESYDVYISNRTAKRATISWISSKDTVGEVRYGTQKNQLNQTAIDVREGVRTRIHYVNLQDLKPETEYWFKVVNDGQSDSTLMNFTTASDGSIPPLEGVYGRVLKSNGDPAHNVLVHLQIVDADGNGSPDRSARLTGLTTIDGYWVDPTDETALNIKSIRQIGSGQLFHYTAGDKVEVEILGGDECDVKRQLDINDVSEETTTQKEAPDLTLTCDQMQETPLSTGWNSVVANFLRTEDANVNSVLSEATDQGAAIEEIAYWHSGQGSWKSKITGKPIGNFPIQPCQGYFVRASEPSLLQIPPSTGIHKCTVTLEQSWNFISLPTTAPTVSASAACRQIENQGGRVTEIAKWSTDKSDWSIHICGSPIGDFEMEAQTPYFIKSDGTSTWNPQKSALAAIYGDSEVDTGLQAVSQPTITDIRYANLSDSAVTVIWQTEKPATGQVHFGNQAGELVHIAQDDRGPAYVGTVHQATLTGLHPERTYWLEVHSGETVDDNAGGFYQIETNPTLAVPQVDTAYGQAVDSAGNPVVGAQVYATVEGAASLATVTDSNGYWTFNLGGLRTADGAAYFAGTEVLLNVAITAPGGEQGSLSLAMNELGPAPMLELNRLEMEYLTYLPVIVR